MVRQERSETGDQRPEKLPGERLTFAGGRVSFAVGALKRWDGSFESQG